MKLFAAMFAAMFATMLLAGCAGPAAVTHGIPNLVEVHPGVYRGGQPVAGGGGWQWLKAQGVTRVVKLNTEAEGSDAEADALWLDVRRFPVTTGQQLLTGPREQDMLRAVASMGPHTFTHCAHGQDRTGLAWGMRRVLFEGWSKDAAWREMRALGFHPELAGLAWFWWERVPPPWRGVGLGHRQRAAWPFDDNFRPGTVPAPGSEPRTKKVRQ